MTGTTSNQPSLSGVGRVELERPEFQEPDEPILWQDDVQQILDDTSCSYEALGLLARLLQGEEVDSMDEADRRGLAALLEGIHCRLFLAVDTLEVIARGFVTPQPVEG